MNAFSRPCRALMLSLTVCAAANLSAREFTDSQGRKLEADIVSVAGDQVTLKRTADGRVFTLPVKTFNTDDQKAMTEFARANLRYAFDVKYTRTKLGKTKSRQGIMQYEKEEWD